MKKLIIFLVTFFSITTNTFSQIYQPFPDSEATWEVTRCWYFYNPGWYDKYTFSVDGTDTLYNGEVFKKIYVTNHHLPGTVYDTIYPTEYFGGIRESNKQIFIYQLWASVDTSILKIYDFNNTNVGDTIYTNVLSGNPDLFGHLVIDTDSVLVGTNFHKRIYLQDINNSYNTEYWIEGVGSSWGLPFATFWSITDNSYDLSCFYESQDLKYENPSPNYGYCQAPLPNISCEIISGINEPIEVGNLFDLYPNPAFDEVMLVADNTFDYLNANLNIYDLTGTLIRSEVVNETNKLIDISGLTSGIYFFLIQYEGKVESEKLIIQR